MDRVRARVDWGECPSPSVRAHEPRRHRATLEGQMSRKAQYVQATNSGLGV